MKLHEFTILWSILILSLLLRIHNLTGNPAGFFCDEASIGYNAYTMLTSGKDEFGSLYPVFFRAFGEYKPPFYIYLAVPSIAIFGLNEFAVRLPAVIVGSLTPLALYLLAKLFFKKKTSLLITLTLAISPWHIHLTRIALDGFSLWIIFTILELYYFYKAQKTNNKFIYYLSYIFFAFNFYTYRASWLINLLLRIALLIKHRRNIMSQKSIHLAGIIISLVVLIPFLIHISTPAGWMRTKTTVNIYKRQELVFNLLNNYPKYFSFKYLFLTGDAGYPNQPIKRHSVLGLGQLYLWQAPLILFGIFTLIRSQKKFAKIILVLLLLYPLAGSITNDYTPFATRSFIGVIPFSILTFCWFDSLKKHTHITKRIKLTTLLFNLLIIATISFSLHDFLVKQSRYPQLSSNFWGWQYGARDIITYFKEQEPNYDQFIMEPRFNASSIFFKFYAPDGCKKCLIGGLDKYNPQLKQLFAVSQDTLINIPDNLYEEKSSIYYPNGQIAFKLVELNYK